MQIHTYDACLKIAEAIEIIAVDKMRAEIQKKLHLVLRDELLSPDKKLAETIAMLHTIKDSTPILDV